MHQPTPEKYRAIGRHLLFWLAYFGYILISEGWQENDSWAFSLPWQDAADIPITMLVVYANLYFLMPRFYVHRRYIPYIAGLFVVLLIGGLTGRFFSWWIWLPRERLADPRSTEPTGFWITARIVKDSAELFPVVVSTMVLKLMRSSFQNEKKLREIEREKFTAEMGLLKAQINPHFFFNTLNSLYSLTLAGSERSPEVVLRLSDLMRYMLYDASANRVLLESEITHLKNYIAIEQMRFADRLDLSFQYSGDLEGKLIAPLLLLPFIENAFKHGIEDNSGWITIDLKVTGDRLFLKVENSFGLSPKTKPEGLGLNNVKRRLDLTYPREYELHLDQHNGIYSADLKMNL